MCRRVGIEVEHLESVREGPNLVGIFNRPRRFSAPYNNS
jgi:hypothetical protein